MYTMQQMLLETYVNLTSIINKHERRFTDLYIMQQIPLETYINLIPRFINLHIKDGAREF